MEKWIFLAKIKFVHDSQLSSEVKGWIWVASVHSHPFNLLSCLHSRQDLKENLPLSKELFFFFLLLIFLMAENNQTYTWKQLVSTGSNAKVNLCQYLGLAKYFKSNCHGPEQILVEFYVCTYICGKRVGGAGENFSRKGLRKLGLSTNAWKGAQT